MRSIRMRSVCPVMPGATFLQIALKEAAETQYWLELLRDAELVKSDKAFTTLCDDCTELIKLLTSSVKTAKAK